MQNKTTNDRPLYRVTFSRITGKDEKGNDVLGKPREIGAIWPRRNGKAGGIMQLDLIPIELTQRNGVIFIVPTDENGGAQ
jgi:hypothetical protein